MQTISYRNIWNLTYPIILSMMAENLISLVDTLFLARVGEVELGASAIGGTFYVIVFIVGLSFSIGTQIIISRRMGEKRTHEVGSIFELSLMFMAVLALIIFVGVYLFFSPIFKSIMSSPEVFEKTVVYVQYRMLGVFFTYIACAYRAFFTGILKTNYLLYNALVLSSVNTFFAYVLIFGKFGFPEMGIKGAAIATVIAEFASVLFYIVVTIKFVNLKKFNLFVKKKYDWRIIGRIMNLSGFIILQNLASLVSWLAFFIIIEQRGQHSLAISNIVRSIYVFLMIPGWAFSSATGALVSNLIGQGNSAGVLKLLHKITRLCLFITIPFLVITIIFPSLILSLFTTDFRLILDSLPSLYMVIVALFVFSFSVSYFSGITGSGNPMISLIIEIIALALYFITIYYFVIMNSYPLHMAWISEIVYFFVVLVLSYIYLGKGYWKGKTV